LRRIWLSKEQQEGYYNGAANEGIWPLCHMVFTRPIFNPKHWPIYREVNEIFAQAVLDEAGDEPAFVFVQDYHFGLLPRILKERNAGNLIVAHFWHIPWPNPEVFQTFPWKEELMDSLLGNDLLGFHLRYHCKNFLDCVDRTLEAKVDYERFEVTRGGKVTVVRPFPISVDFAEHEAMAGSEEVDAEMERWSSQLGLAGEALGIGIDRIDYTKGIPERLRAIDRVLELHPDLREQLIFVQIGVPSRTHVKAYQLLDDEIDGLVESINWRWSTDSWKPIVYLKQQFNTVQMMALHRLARFCIVNSLDDGMNLVAKEFVASRTDEDGVLILSRFTGAARELTDAVLVNPFSIDEMAEALHASLEMPEEERTKRMQKLRGVVAENNIYRWAGKYLSTLLKFEFPEAEADRAAPAMVAVG
jgi:trehalose 6-phosphate synthase